MRLNALEQHKLRGKGELHLKRFTDHMEQFDRLGGEVAADGMLGVPAHPLSCGFGHLGS